jgi:hypothetical protein
MIVETFLKRVQNEERSNRKLVCIMTSATMLYMARLLNDKMKMQKQFEDYQIENTDVDKGSANRNETALEHDRFALTQYGGLASLWRIVFSRPSEPLMPINCLDLMTSTTKLVING